MMKLKREFSACSIALFAALALAACGDAPAPKPQAKAEPVPVTPAPVAAAPAAPAPAPAPQAEKPDPNKELAQRVKRALEDESHIQAAAIDVTAADGKVTLWGTAASPDEKNRATRAAYRVQGVTNVENKLAVVKGS
ncbi:MAG TPA: BON domain-containing protein [Burkholderiales bacterium]|jgi:hypothetical protein